jgi:hypothetical protein
MYKQAFTLNPLLGVSPALLETESVTDNILIKGRGNKK